MIREIEKNAIYRHFKVDHVKYPEVKQKFRFEKVDARSVRP